ncbi:hypothetical protein Bbelb_169040 [Branchiostoma belcheri]|nr:hypothetical protein Bbelb_169040 [Branchiostoma belcheri]
MRKSELPSSFANTAYMVGEGLNSPPTTVFALLLTACPLVLSTSQDTEDIWRLTSGGVASDPRFLGDMSGRVSAQDQSFRQQPESVAVRLGETVTLTCAIDNVAGVVQWTKDNFALGSDRALPGYPRHTITGDLNRGEYNLLIQDVLLEDDGKYQCQASPTETQGGIRSEDAELTIYRQSASPAHGVLEKEVQLVWQVVVHEKLFKSREDLVQPV